MLLAAMLCIYCSHIHHLSHSHYDLIFLLFYCGAVVFYALIALTLKKKMRELRDFAFDFVTFFLFFLSCFKSDLNSLGGQCVCIAHVVSCSQVLRNHGIFIKTGSNIDLGSN